jgi:hypothetical protein
MKSSASCEFLCLQNAYDLEPEQESLIKLAESNGKHQQPNPIRKKGYG